MAIIAAIMILLIYLSCPILGKIALLIANTLIPDPIPFVDEFIMWMGLFIHLSRLMKLAEFVRNHKKAVAVAFIVLVILFIAVIIFFI